MIKNDFMRKERSPLKRIHVIRPVAANQLMPTIAMPDERRTAEVLDDTIRLADAPATYVSASIRITESFFVTDPIHCN